MDRGVGASIREHGGESIQEGRLELITPAQVATASLIYPRESDL
jgi:hypothetical protein